MFKRTRLSNAVAAALAISATGVAHADVEEIIVTATKRAENAQDIPITVQALNEESLRDLNINTFSDYIANLPGVASGGRGPGRNEVYIRGVSAGKGGLKSAGVTGSEPNVALYLDEAPISVGARNIDIYVTDMNRVEVLPGPQGTLFGASSQAGTVRLITNKPEFNEFGGSVNTSFSNTQGGENSTSVEAAMNLPLIEDKLAARFAFYSVRQGGYIDNIAGVKQIPASNENLPGKDPDDASKPTTVTDFPTVSNVPFAQDNFNDAYYQGMRASLKYAFNDDWELLLQHQHQDLNTEGVWDFDPRLGDFNVMTFAPDAAEDILDLSAWTLTGRIGSLDLVYTGSYIDRAVDSTQDYSGYVDAGWVVNYFCAGTKCGRPNLSVNMLFGLKRLSNEFRINTDQDNRFRVIAGVFFDDNELTEQGDFFYPDAINVGGANGTIAPNDPIPGSQGSDMRTREPGIVYFNDFVRERKEVSVFGEAAFDVTESLTATLGLRHYNLELALRGGANSGTAGLKDDNDGNNVTEILGNRSPEDFDDTLGKFNLNWKLNDDALVFFTWSEGYRPGGFNRNPGEVTVKGKAQGVQPVPVFFESDELTNIEIGWKTTLADGDWQFNGAIYMIEWDNIQIKMLNRELFSNLSFSTNAGSAEIQGMEFDSIWTATDNFTLFANVSFNDSELTEVPTHATNIVDVGEQLAQSPELQYTLRGRYEWSTNSGLDAFAQLSYQYTDEQYASIEVSERFKQEDYAIVNTSFGVSRDDWTMTFFVDNATDELAQLFINFEDDIVKITPNRPRTYGMRLGYNF